MDNKEKVMGMLQLLDMNDDLFCYEMTSLARKIDNFLDDRSRLLSGRWLDVMYVSLTDEGVDEAVEIDTDDVLDKTGNDIDDSRIDDVQEENSNETFKILANDLPGESSPSFEDSRFALV